MNMTDIDYARLHSVVFDPRYPGYNPDIIEAPNGDGRWDHDKRYAHIAKKYLDRMLETPAKKLLSSVLWQTMDYARGVASRVGVSAEFWPSNDSTIRVLEYPPGVGGEEHTDFDLFTLCLYRNFPDKFIYTTDEPDENKLEELFHWGELAKELTLAEASGHRIAPTQQRSQYSVVFFAIPPHDAKLPSGITVGEWLDERKGRSRKPRNEYKH